MTEVNRIYAKNKTRTEVTLHFTRAVTDPDDFIEEVQMFSAVDEDDSVRMLILSPGGQLDTCQLIVKAMRECKAPILGWIGPTCASAGSAIALACDDWEVDDMSMLMIHTASFGEGGKAPEVESAIQAKLAQIRMWVESTYSGFLTPDEIEAVIGGKDFYFHKRNGLVERLRAYGEYRYQQRLQELKDLQAEIEEEEARLLDEEEEVVVISPTKPKRQRKSS
jgi:ATP-dependent protease ClpP protease subunit